MTFDAWEGGVYCPDDVLMHWGIPGMKHGRRRYQNEDGTWTEQGLAERRKREGFGERRAERKAAKLERKAARREAREQKRAEVLERSRQRNLKNVSDEELRKMINRAKMEQEYKEITKSPLLKTGENLFNKIMDYKAGQDQRAIESAKQKLEMERLKTERVKAQEATKKSRYDSSAEKSKAKKAKEETKMKVADVKGGLKIQRKKELEGVKLATRKTTLRGAIGSFLNGRAVNAGQGSGEAAKIRKIADAHYHKNVKAAEAAIDVDNKINKHNKKLKSGYKHLNRKTNW